MVSKKMASHARKSMSDAVHSGGREQPCGGHGRQNIQSRHDRSRQRQKSGDGEDWSQARVGLLEQNRRVILILAR